MSMQYNSISGYGFPYDCNDENLIDFIKAHKDTFCQSKNETDLYQKLLEATKDEYNIDIEDFFYYYKCDNDDEYGVGAVIANIMSRETGIRFSSASEDDIEELPASVLFRETLPWLLNDTEKNLSKRKLSAICKKYTKELGISDTPSLITLRYFD